jgi:6-phosphofructokinase 1
VQTGRLGILVGGGPAPGINGVIAAATIEAIYHDLEVVGLLDGYSWLTRGDASHTRPLDIEAVSRIHATGGSILRTSRVNPAKEPEMLQNAIRTLHALNIRYLLCIGGDDTTYGATRIAEAAAGTISVATVPKTIDNDLPLPENMPTFGFETARSVGSAIVQSLIEDARSTSRWFFAITMGRKSGSLALGICKAAAATLAVIPEEFEVPRLSLSLVADTIVGSMLKRRAAGRFDGVAVVAEGIAEKLDPAELGTLADAPRDAYGHVRLADVALGTVVRDAVLERLGELGLDIGVVTKDIGYELRCATPVPFDVDYARTLGYGAVRYLLGGGSGAMVALKGGRIEPVTLQELTDPDTGRVRARSVDTTTESYEVSRRYQIRLEPRDLEEPQRSRLAAEAGLSPADFVSRFHDVIAATCRVPDGVVASVP